MGHKVEKMGQIQYKYPTDFEQSKSNRRQKRISGCQFTTCTSFLNKISSCLTKSPLGFGIHGPVENVFGILNKNPANDKLPPH